MTPAERFEGTLRKLSERIVEICDGTRAALHTNDFRPEIEAVRAAFREAVEEAKLAGEAAGRVGAAERIVQAGRSEYERGRRECTEKPVKCQEHNQELTGCDKCLRDAAMDAAGEQHWKEVEEREF